LLRFLARAMGDARVLVVVAYRETHHAEGDAFARGLVNEVVPAADLMEVARSMAREIAERSPLAIGALKGAFSARHNGVSGQARMAHDQHLTLYLTTAEAHEVGSAFGERRAPDPERFWR